MDEHCCTCYQAERRVGILQVAEQVLAHSGPEFDTLQEHAAALLYTAFKDAHHSFLLKLPSFPRD